MSNQLTDEMRDQAYQEIIANTDPYYDTLRKSFEDPSGNSREPVLILFDSSKFSCEKSFDKLVQWMCYFDPKRGT